MIINWKLINNRILFLIFQSKIWGLAYLLVVEACFLVHRSHLLIVFLLWWKARQLSRASNPCTNYYLMT